MSTESDGVEREIKELREQISKIQQSVHDTHSSEGKFREELECIRKESEKLANKNKALESKIAIREEQLSKKQIHSKKPEGEN